MASHLLLVLVGLIALATSTTFFSEDFSDKDWQSRWVQSTVRAEHERGSMELSAGKYFKDEAAETGLKTSTDARFYTYSTEIPEEFSNKDKTLVLQYSVKQDQNIDCGGAYIKLHPAGLDQEKYDGDSEYNIMFGPDICGSSTRRTHFILTKNKKNHLVTKDIPCETDEFTHVYTLVLKPDNTFQVLIDGEEKRAGDIADEFTILEPKQINDPKESKPSDWVDERMIQDPEATKPEGYDDIPKEIVDPEATKPEDWDDELDGDWEAPTIPNPEYKGPWTPKMIENPAYKGEWVHPQIDNPAYKPDDTLYSFDSHKFIGIEIWQVKAGSVFDNILVTDDEAEAESARAAILTRKDGEAELSKADKEKAAAEAEAAAAASKEEEAEVEDKEEDAEEADSEDKSEEEKEEL